LSASIQRSVAAGMVGALLMTETLQCNRMWHKPTRRRA